VTHPRPPAQEFGPTEDPKKYFFCPKKLYLTKTNTTKRFAPGLRRTILEKKVF
jgi:hypothetical protein